MSGVRTRGTMCHRQMTKTRSLRRLLRNRSQHLSQKKRCRNTTKNPQSTGMVWSFYHVNVLLKRLSGTTFTKPTRVTSSAIVNGKPILPRFSDIDSLDRLHLEFPELVRAAEPDVCGMPSGMLRANS